MLHIVDSPFQRGGFLLAKIGVFKRYIADSSRWIDISGGELKYFFDLKKLIPPKGDFVNAVAASKFIKEQFQTLLNNSSLRN